MPAYYDVVLMLIPFLFLGVGGSLTIAGLPLTVAVAVGGCLAMAAIGHALFLRPPTDARKFEDTPPRSGKRLSQ